MVVSNWTPEQWAFVIASTLTAIGALITGILTTLSNIRIQERTRSLEGRVERQKETTKDLFNHVLGLAKDAPPPGTQINVQPPAEVTVEKPKEADHDAGETG